MGTSSTFLAEQRAVLAHVAAQTWRRLPVGWQPTGSTPASRSLRVREGITARWFTTRKGSEAGNLYAGVERT